MRRHCGSGLGRVLGYLCGHREAPTLRQVRLDYPDSGRVDVAAELRQTVDVLAGCERRGGLRCERLQIVEVVAIERLLEPLNAVSGERFAHGNRLGEVPCLIGIREQGKVASYN